MGTLILVYDVGDSASDAGGDGMLFQSPTDEESSAATSSSIRSLLELGEEDMTSLTKLQQKVLAFLPILPAMLSIMGSSTIICLVLRKKSNTQRSNQTRRSYSHGSNSAITPLDRILFVESICDIMFSTTCVLQSFLVPKASSQRIYAIGNDATCTALGFFTQLAFASFWFYGMMSLYFLLTVRFGMKPEFFARRIEPFVHVVSIGYPLVTASIGAVISAYNEADVAQGCWIKDYPRNCGNEPHETGERCFSPMLAWIFAGIPVMCMLLTIIVCNMMIYLYVRKTTYRHLRRNNLAHPRAAGEVAGDNTGPTVVRRRTSVGSELSETQQKRVKMVATQCFLYVGAFLSTYMWPVFLRVLEGNEMADTNDESTLFPLLVLQAALLPLTGFFNLVVYLRPRYLRCRQDFPMQSRIWAARRGLFGDVIEPSQLSSSRRRSPLFRKVFRLPRTFSVTSDVRATTPSDIGGRNSGAVVSASVASSSAAREEQRQSNQVVKTRENTYLPATASGNPETDEGAREGSQHATERTAPRRWSIFGKVFRIPFIFIGPAETLVTNNERATTPTNAAAATPSCNTKMGDKKRKQNQTIEENRETPLRTPVSIDVETTEGETERSLEITDRREERESENCTAITDGILLAPGQIHETGS